MRRHVTGCVSVASTDKQVTLDRIIECVNIEPVAHTCTIIVDTFVYNATATQQMLRIIHRGSLTATDVTHESWSSGSAVEYSVVHGLAERLAQLHQGYDDIRVLDAGVQVGEYQYELWDGPATKIPAVLGDMNWDVPFTMWEIGPFAPRQRSVARLKLEMSLESYLEQVGNGERFYAYGDAILRDTIEYKDLAAYRRSDNDLYRTTLRNFHPHLLPATFEWLLVSLDGRALPWKVTPLSANFAPQVIPDDGYSATTQWFVARYGHVGEFCVEGKLSNAFAARVEHAVAAAAC